MSQILLIKPRQKAFNASKDAYGIMAHMRMIVAIDRRRYPISRLLCDGCTKSLTFDPHILNF